MRQLTLHIARHTRSHARVRKDCWNGIGENSDYTGERGGQFLPLRLLGVVIEVVSTGSAGFPNVITWAGD